MPKEQPELYFSVDIECDGPIPGVYSMLSLGCAAFTGDGILVESYSANFDRLLGSIEDPETMGWWKTQPKAWEECRTATLPPEEGIPVFVEWVQRMSVRYRAKPICIAYPAGFDFTFLYWYMRRFAGGSPFGFSCIDIKTYAMALLGTPYQMASKEIPDRWLSNHPHTHVALDDAIEQGELFCNMLKENVRQEVKNG